MDTVAPPSITAKIVTVLVVGIVHAEHIPITATPAYRWRPRDHSLCSGHACGCSYCRRGLLSCWGWCLLDLGGRGRLEGRCWGRGVARADDGRGLRKWGAIASCE